jgi:polar amino acid transport system substrate-binding protein
MVRGVSMTSGFAALLLAAAPAWPADLAEIRQRGALRVLGVLDAREPEFFSLKSEAAPGLDIEILTGFAKLYKVDLKVVPATGWSALVPALIEAKGDLIAGRFSASPRSRPLIAFTQEVFPTRMVVVTRRPHPDVQSLEQLRNEHVGTIAGTSMYEAMLTAGLLPSGIDSTLGSGDLASALRSGKITAAVWWLEGAIRAQRKDPELNLGLALGPPESLAYGVRKEDVNLLGALNQHLELLRSTGTWQRLVLKYFGDSMPEILKAAHRK